MPTASIPPPTNQVFSGDRLQLVVHPKQATGHMRGGTVTPSRSWESSRFDLVVAARAWDFARGNSYCSYCAAPRGYTNRALTPWTSEDDLRSAMELITRHCCIRMQAA